GVDRPRGREVRELAAASRAEIERHDLDGVLACRAGSHVGVDDRSTVRAEAQGLASREVEHAARASGLWDDNVAVVATRGAEPAQPTAVGADVKDALLLRDRSDAREDGVVGDLEDHARSIRARRQPLKVAAEYGG